MPTNKININHTKAKNRSQQTQHIFLGICIACLHYWSASVNQHCHSRQRQLNFCKSVGRICPWQYWLGLQRQYRVIFFIFIHEFCFRGVTLRWVDTSQHSTTQQITTVFFQALALINLCILLQNGNIFASSFRLQEHLHIGQWSWVWSQLCSRNYTKNVTCSPL